jgi:carbon storage regulator
LLVLTRKPGEKVVLNGNVTLTVIETRGHRVRLTFDAPAHVPIFREELCSLGKRHDAFARNENLTSQRAAGKLSFGRWRVGRGLVVQRPLDALFDVVGNLSGFLQEILSDGNQFHRCLVDWLPVHFRNLRCKARKACLPEGRNKWRAYRGVAYVIPEDLRSVLGP